MTFDPNATLATTTFQTLDGVLAIDIPIDLVVQPQRQAVLATSADGGYRFYLAHRPGATLPAELGGLKDELLGLGWEVVSEQHFESAVLVSLVRGPKTSRTYRELWLVEGSGRVAICEAIARDAYRARLGDPLRKTCQAMRLTAPAEAPAPTP